MQFGPWMLTHETIFLTGFPGFIAGRLVERLTIETSKFLLLVQPHLVTLAQEKIDEIVNRTGSPQSKFQILEGDVTRSDLGLSPADLDRARSKTTTIFHLAAAYDLAVQRDVAMAVNLGGTRNVNDFARSIRSLDRYHYISTCYIAGRRSGLILETELQHKAGFRNHYEESKYLAEIAVEELKAELPVTIHRPSVVCGDSKTGETAKYDGIYYLINYLHKWPRVLRVLNIGNQRVTLNLVPVDFVVEAIATLAKDERAIGKTFQIADPNPLTTHELFNSIAYHFVKRRSRITVPESVVYFTLMLPPSPHITALPHSAVPYFFLKQTYDVKQSLELLNQHAVHCPPFPSYVGRIIEYAIQHQQT